jgi:amidase
MAGTVEDTALFMSVLAVEEKGDPLSWSGIKGSDFLPQNLPKVDLKGLKVGFSADLGGNIAIDPIVRETFDGNLPRLTALFAPGSKSIDDELKTMFSLPEIPQKSPNVNSFHDVFSVLRAEHFLSNLAARIPANRDKLAFPVSSNIDIAESYAYEDRMVAHAHAGLLFKKWTKLMETYDLVVLPTASAAPFDKMEQWAPEVVGGKKMENYFEWICITCG